MFLASLERFSVFQVEGIGDVVEETLVGNTCFFSALVQMREFSVFSVCILFEESVCIFQFLNDKMHRKQNMTVNVIIQKLKINTFSSKIYKLKKLILSPRDSQLSQLVYFLRKMVFLNDEIHSYVLFDIIQKLKHEHTFLKKYTN